MRHPQRLVEPLPHASHLVTGRFGPTCGTTSSHSAATRALSGPAHDSSAGQYGRRQCAWPGGGTRSTWSSLPVSAGGAVASPSPHYEYPAGAGSHVRASGAEDQRGTLRAPAWPIAIGDDRRRRALGDPPGDLVERPHAAGRARPGRASPARPAAGAAPCCAAPGRRLPRPGARRRRPGHAPGRARVRPVPGGAGAAARPRPGAAGRGGPLPGPRRPARPRRPAVRRPGHAGRAAALAAHCRVVVALRTPHRLPAEAVDALRAAAAGWLAVPPLDAGAAADLARRVAPGLGAAAVDDGGPPGRRGPAGGHRAGPPRRRGPGAAGPDAGTTDTDQVAYAVAAALADLTRPARTAMAALGLLGRPADAARARRRRRRAGRAAGLVAGDRRPRCRSPRTWPRWPPACSTQPARQALHRRLAEAGAGPGGGPAPGRGR